MELIFRTVIDDSLGVEVRVTVIATGFDSAGPSRAVSAEPGPGKVISSLASVASDSAVERYGCKEAATQHRTAR